MLYSQPFSFLDLINEKSDEYIYNSSVMARDIPDFENFEGFVKLGNAQTLLSSSMQAICLYPYYDDIETISEYYNNLSDYQWYCQNKLFDKICGYVTFSDETERHGFDIGVSGLSKTASLDLFFKVADSLQPDDYYCLSSFYINDKIFQVFVNDSGSLLAYIDENPRWTSDSHLLTGSWHFLSISLDTDEICFYIDGIKETTVLNLNIDNCSSFKIADYQQSINGLALKSWAGSIKEVRLWDVARAHENEIGRNIWNSVYTSDASYTSDNLQSYFRFNEGYIDDTGTELYEKYFNSKWLDEYADSLNSRILDYSKHTRNSSIYGNFSREVFYTDASYYDVSDNFRDYITVPIIFDSYIPTDTNMLSLYDEQMILAREFDEFNKSSLLNYIPQYYFNNTDDPSFYIFICALSNFLDEFKVKIDREILYDGNIYSKTRTTTLDNIEKKLKKYGFDATKQFKNLDIWTKILNSKYNYFEARKRIFYDLSNDLTAIAKEKGTLNAVNNILNIARLTSNIYAINHIDELKNINKTYYEKYVNRPELVISSEETITTSQISETFSDSCTIALKFRINDITSGSNSIDIYGNKFNVVWDDSSIYLESLMEGDSPGQTLSYSYNKNDEYVVYYRFNNGTFQQGLAAVYKDILDKVLEEGAISQQITLTPPAPATITCENSNLITFGFSNSYLTDEQIRRDDFDFLVNFDTLKINYTEPTEPLYDYNMDLKVTYDYNFDATEASEENLIATVVEINPSLMLKNQTVSDYYNCMYNVIDVEGLEKISINYSDLLNRLKYLDINIPDYVSKVMSKYQSSAPYVIENPWSIRDKEILSYLKTGFKPLTSSFNIPCTIEL